MLLGEDVGGGGGAALELTGRGETERRGEVVDRARGAVVGRRLGLDGADGRIALRLGARHGVGEVVVMLLARIVDGRGAWRREGVQRRRLLGISGRGAVEMLQLLTRGVMLLLLLQLQLRREVVEGIV